MRIFKSKWFAKFARKECIPDARLCDAVSNAEQGMIDADYGDGVIKQRIPRPNAGKSGGYRSIILFHRGDRAFFVYGFAKNAQDSIDKSDERDFKELARTVLAASDTELENLVSDGKYVEVTRNDQNL
ncbi:MAG: type II toxin-antitoxin system RelE/ParE family toxin [Magnetococcus sp. YQC-3]